MNDDIAVYRLGGTPYDINKVAEEYETETDVTFSHAATANQYGAGPHWSASYEGGFLTAVCEKDGRESEMYLVAENEPDPAQPAHEMFVRFIKEDMGWEEVMDAGHVKRTLEHHGYSPEQKAREETMRDVQSVFQPGPRYRERGR